MKCREFQKIIPEIINDKVKVEQLEEIIDHVSNCKDCYDEMEIYYVLQYGLDENESRKSMNFVGQLDDKIKEMKSKARKYDFFKSSYNLIYILANTAVAGAFIYTVFNLF